MNKFMQYKDGAKFYNLSDDQFQKLVLKADAIFRIRNVVLINMEKIEKYRKKE